MKLKTPTGSHINGTPWVNDTFYSSIGRQAGVTPAFPLPSTYYPFAALKSVLA